MDSNRFSKKVVSPVNTSLNQQNKLVLKFEPGTSVPHIKEWVNYLIKQAHAGNGQLSISADSMHVNADGTVVITGKNVGTIQAKAGKNGKSASMGGGDVMTGVDSVQAPIPPRPRLPDPNEINAILAKSVGQTIPLTNILKNVNGKTKGL
jgi:hypothetical protein